MDLIGELNNLPIPPTINSCYAGKNRRFKSGDYKEFDNQLLLWAKQNRKDLGRIRRKIGQLGDSPMDQFIIELVVYFPIKQLVNKCDGRTKANDASNRLKPLEDGIVGIIGLDDRHFWDVSIKKRISPIGKRYCEGRIYYEYRTEIEHWVAEYLA